MRRTEAADIYRLCARRGLLKPRRNARMSLPSYGRAMSCASG